MSGPGATPGTIPTYGNGPFTPTAVGANKKVRDALRDAVEVAVCETCALYVHVVYVECVEGNC
jgi:hypothetical protein